MTSPHWRLLKVDWTLRGQDWRLLRLHTLLHMDRPRRLLPQLHPHRLLERMHRLLERMHQLLEMMHRLLERMHSPHDSPWFEADLWMRKRH